MIRRILNNIMYDISGNFALIARYLGIYKAVVYLSRAILLLGKAVLLNRTREVYEVEFYDTWWRA
jgi:hypothetical protein